MAVYTVAQLSDVVFLNEQADKKIKILDVSSPNPIFLSYKNKYQLIQVKRNGGQFEMSVEEKTQNETENGALHSVTYTIYKNQNKILIFLEEYNNTIGLRIIGEGDDRIQRYSVDGDPHSRKEVILFSNGTTEDEIFII